MNLLSAALEYAERGWYVFPVSPGNKVPIPGTHGHLDATVNPDIIREWWKYTPQANIGMSLEPSGLYLLDIDVAEGKKGRESLLSIDKELPDSLVQRSARGGIHVFYLRGAHPVTRKTGTMPGVDLYGSGYVLLSPSTLTGGSFAGAANGATGEYSWITPGTTIAQLPPVLVTLLSRATPRAVITTTELEPLPGGSRNTSLFRLAASLRDHGLSVAAIEAALTVANKERCTPPLPASEIATISASAGKITPSKDVAGNAVFAEGLAASVQAEVVLPTGFEAALLLARNDITIALGTSLASTPVPLFESGLELITRVYPPTPWLVRGLLTEGGTMVVGGEPKTSKTWVLCEIAIGLATGTPIFGEFFTIGHKNVAYFFAEDDGASVRNRLLSLCKGRNLPPEVALRNIYPQPRGRFIDLSKDSDLALVVASCRAIGRVDVVIMEPLRDLHSGDEDSSGDMGPLFRRIRCIGEVISKGQKSPCTPCVAHHMKKPSKDSVSNQPGQKLRGSSAIHGSVDSGLYLSDLRESVDGAHTTFTNTMHSQIKGAKGAGVFDVALTIEDGPQRTAISAAWRMGENVSDVSALRARILTVVTAACQGGNSLTRNQIATTIGGKRDIVVTVVEAMTAEGLLLSSFIHMKGHEVTHPVYITPEFLNR